MSLVALVSAAGLGLAACGGGEDTAATDTTTTSEAPSETPMETPMEDMETTEPGMEMMAGPVGPGCADFTEQVPDGEGSVEGMTDDPVATAASNNPLLTQLTAAVSGQLNPDVNLVDTLNGDEFTVFAPVDDAFAALDPATVETLQTPEGAETLTTVLTYHVVPGQMDPQMVADAGTLTTVQGGDLEVSGEPDMLMVNGANVICGGVQTANATVYLIDGVLMPPA
ncbi:fasciclin domain-containing protein [Kineococcus sp. SYSU DK004]|uniref:fasciclin domain-containing protein n=1 Tax=Kineococcus sp. SYSU DK004 TaxID=3383125 RepID=UPI003D7E86ED